MNPQVENLRIVLRRLVQTYQHSQASYHDVYMSISEVADLWERTHTCPIDAEWVFGPWFARLIEHVYKPLLAKDDRHFAPGETPTPIEALSTKTDHERPKMAPGDVTRPRHQDAEVKRRHPQSFKAYMLGKSTIYVVDTKTRTHYTTEKHWKDYLALRKEVPQLVKIVDKLKDLQRELFETQGVVF